MITRIIKSRGLKLNETLWATIKNDNNSNNILSYQPIIDIIKDDRNIHSKDYTITGELITGLLRLMMNNLPRINEYKVDFWFHEQLNPSILNIIKFNTTYGMHLLVSILNDIDLLNKLFNPYSINDDVTSLQYTRECGTSEENE